MCSSRAFGTQQVGHKVNVPSVIECLNSSSWHIGIRNVILYNTRLITCICHLPVVCLCVKHFSFLYKGQTSLPLMLETWDLDICNPGDLNFQFKATSSFV